MWQKKVSSLYCLWTFPLLTSSTTSYMSSHFQRILVRKSCCLEFRKQVKRNHLTEFLPLLFAQHSLYFCLAIICYRGTILINAAVQYSLRELQIFCAKCVELVLLGYRNEVLIDILKKKILENRNDNIIGFDHFCCQLFF